MLSSESARYYVHALIFFLPQQDKSSPKINNQYFKHLHQQF